MIRTLDRLARATFNGVPLSKAFNDNPLGSSCARDQIKIPLLVRSIFCQQTINEFSSRPIESIIRKLSDQLAGRFRSPPIAAYCHSINFTNPINNSNNRRYFHTTRINLKKNMSSYSQYIFQSNQEKEEAIKGLCKSNWTRAAHKDAITKTFLFRNFIQAFSFMTSVALESEKIDHHPEWMNVYNRVEVTLTSHFCDGVSLLDIKMAKTIDDIYFNAAKS